MRPSPLLPGLLLLTLACAHGPTLTRQYDALVSQGQWLSARELLENARELGETSPALIDRLGRLEETVKRHAENLDFDPLKYFYARAYIEFYQHRRYGRAAEAMDLVLAYALEDEEMVRFLDKALALAQEEEAQQAKVKPIPAAPKPSASPPARARPPPAAEPVSGEVLEARYDAALRAYLQRDLGASAKLLRANAAAEPNNPRWRNTLDRIERELGP